MSTAAVVALSLPAFAKDPKPGDKQCDVGDAALTELSGLVATDDGYYAVGDGTNDQVQLDLVKLDGECASTGDILTAIDATEGTLTDPADPEDLAMDADGALWVADTGDNINNAERRETIALHKVAPDGTTNTYRFTYPDGPHDTEALLLPPEGAPIFATKDPGESKFFSPTGALDEALDRDNPMPMEEIGSFKIKATETKGGPKEVGGIELGDVPSTMVTGGAVSADGEKAVLRTYTDAYEWTVKDGDVAAALTGDSKPTITALPEEPQGEAISYSADGKNFITASEAVFDDSGNVATSPQLWSYEPASGDGGDKDEAEDAAEEAEGPGLAQSILDFLGIDGILWVIAGIGLIGFGMVILGIITIRKSRIRRRLKATSAPPPPTPDDYDYDDRPAPHGPYDDGPPHGRPGPYDDGLSGGRLFDEHPPRRDDGYDEWPRRREEPPSGNVYGGGNTYGGGQRGNTYGSHDEGGSGTVYGGGDRR